MKYLKDAISLIIWAIILILMAGGIMTLTSCGLIDDIEEAIDPPPETVRRVHIITIGDSATVDTTMGEPRPALPKIGVGVVILGNGGAE